MFKELIRDGEREEPYPDLEIIVRLLSAFIRAKLS